MTEILFEVSDSYFNKRVRTTAEYWQEIVNEKHPSIKGNEQEVTLTVQNPDEIRQSKNIIKFFYTINCFKLNISVSL